MTDLTRPSRPETAPRGLELRAALLLALFVALLGATVLYLMYARGSFEPTQRLVLIADDSEGVRVGMDLSFAGFPVGRVRRVELGEDGSARILIDVPRKDARWLRESSVFTLVRSLVGSATLRAYSGVLSDPPLADGAERRVLVGDTAAELPRMLATARDLLANLTQLSAPDAPLAGTLANLQTLSARLNGPGGAAGVLFGGNAEMRKIDEALGRINQLLARVDGIAARADAQVLGPGGLLNDGKAVLAQLNGALADARQTLRKVDAVLAEAEAVAGEAKAVAANARIASTDLGALRREVDATVRKVEGLVDELNRRWPFARDTELELR